MNKQEMLSKVKNYLNKFSNKNTDKIISAMNSIDRRYFVPEKIPEGIIYFDFPINIGQGQTISQPSTVARMLQLLEIKQDSKILEIGSGSGWNTALMKNLAYKGNVISYEIIKELVNLAKKNIKKSKIKNVRIILGDFRKEKRKFDRIIFTAGIKTNQENFIEKFAKEHLNDNGILICSFRFGPIIILRKENNKLKKTYTKEEYSFVPLFVD